MLPDMPYAGITVPACLKVVVFRFLVAITYEKQRNYVFAWLLILSTFGVCRHWH